MQVNYEKFEQAEANYVPLSPVSFLNRAQSLHGHRTAIIYGDLRRSWAEFATHTRAVAAGLTRMGIAKGDTVSIFLPEHS